LAKFTKGKSGNPAGRQRGSTNRTTRAFREAVAHVFDELGGERHLLAWAKKHATEYYRIYARMVPPGSPVNLGQLSGTLADQGKSVMEAMTIGNITPEQAATIMSALSSHARIVEIDELARRLMALEERSDVKTGR
jgi:hypothetical protein